MRRAAAALGASALALCGCAGSRIGILRRPESVQTRNYRVSFNEAWTAAESAAVALGLSIWEEEKAKGCFGASRGPGVFQGSKELRVCLKRDGSERISVRVADSGLSWGGVFKPDPPGWTDRFFAAIAGALPAASEAAASAGR